jgi:hypothetical protein
LNLRELSCKEVVGILDPVDLLGLGERVVERFYLIARSKFVSSPLDNELGFRSPAEEAELMRSHRDSQPYQGANARVGCPHREPHPGAERKPHHTYWGFGETSLEVIESCPHVPALPHASREGSPTFPHAAKIESQRRKTRLKRGLRNAKDYLVVQRPAVLRVGMTHQSDEPGAYRRI